MGYIINDQNFINDNVYKFEKRLESQYTVFLDKNPTFVTYFHINTINSTVDNGFLNVEQIVGDRSPIRYQEIVNFPIYGIEQIQLSLSDEEEGLQGSYESEGIILPNTIKPLPNDYFYISYLGDQYLFMVTEVNYDTIKSNNFYKINYYLKSVDGTEDIVKLRNQVIKKYNCIFKNIGTDDKCLIESDVCEKIAEIEKIYKSIVDRYITLFYNKKFNSILFHVDDDKTYVYDKFLTHFINKNNLLNEKEEYNTFVLNNEDYGTHFTVQYEESIFDIIENKSKERLSYIRYDERPITYQQSIFNFYHMLNHVYSIYFFGRGKYEYLPDKLIDSIYTADIPEDSTIIDEMIIKYFTNDYDSVYAINTDRLKWYRIGYNEKDFRQIPILLYLLRYNIKKFLSM